VFVIGVGEYADLDLALASTAVLGLVVLVGADQVVQQSLLRSTHSREEVVVVSERVGGHLMTTTTTPHQFMSHVTPTNSLCWLERTSA
jgi:hypothetical protein